jgi:hypothetical protein
MHSGIHACTKDTTVHHVVLARFPAGAATTSSAPSDLSESEFEPLELDELDEELSLLLVSDEDLSGMSSSCLANSCSQNTRFKSNFSRRSASLSFVKFLNVAGQSFTFPKSAWCDFLLMRTTSGCYTFGDADTSLGGKRWQTTGGNIS